MRYLQDCIEKLQSRDPQTPTDKTSMSTSFQPAPYNPEAEYQTHSQHYADREDDDDEDDEEEQQQHSPDVEMANTSDATPSPTFTTRPPSSTTTPTYSSSSSHHHHHQHQSSMSPALNAQDMHRHNSYASIHSAATADHRHYSFSASPAVGPTAGWGSGAGMGGYALPPPLSSNPGSTLTSPALGPLRERDLDQEATAALLMLNSDRRGTVVRESGERSASSSGSTSSGAGRGMSVRDLLSA